MKVSEINAGKKADWTLDGTNLTITIGEDQAITTDLAAAQKDTEQIVTVFLDGQANLHVETGQWYVASIIIPAKKTHMIESEELDEQGDPQIIKETLPLDPDDVSLVLWALHPIAIKEEGGTL